MKHFSTDGEWGTLQPYRSGLRLRIPSWFALIIAIPLLVLCAAAFVAHSLPAQLLFGVPGALFLVLWFISRRVSRDFGLVRINQKTKLGVFTNRDGSENTVHFGRFQSIKIERVLAGHIHSWMAVLCGDSGNLILEMGYSFQRPLINRVTPVATWLGIPIEVSDRKIYITEWLARPDFRTNPYSSPQHMPNPSFKGDALKRAP
jgi:hypothetical protein